MGALQAKDMYEEIHFFLLFLDFVPLATLQLRIPAMHETNKALLDILVENSVIIPSFQNRTSTF